MSADVSYSEAGPELAKDFEGDTLRQRVLLHQLSGANCGCPTQTDAASGGWGGPRFRPTLGVSIVCPPAGAVATLLEPQAIAWSRMYGNRSRFLVEPGTHLVGIRLASTVPIQANIQNLGWNLHV